MRRTPLRRCGRGGTVSLASSQGGVPPNFDFDHVCMLFDAGERVLWRASISGDSAAKKKAALLSKPPKPPPPPCWGRVIRVGTSDFGGGYAIVRLEDGGETVLIPNTDSRTILTRAASVVGRRRWLPRVGRRWRARASCRPNRAGNGRRRSPSCGLSPSTRNSRRASRRR